MTRLLVPLIALAVATTLRGSAGPLSPFDVVDIKPVTTSVYVATVSMTMPPFVRKGSLFASTYVAKVFPYFLFNEKGRIWIELSDNDLRRVANGEPVNFVGRAVSESGNIRRVEGRAVPTGPRAGTVRVRVFVTRRISLSYNTSYRLIGPEPLEADANPMKTR
jgi:hypothetical protein